MTEYADIISGIYGLLKSTFPQVKSYGNDSTEGMKRPYFFVECIPGGISYETINFAKRSCVLKITYFPPIIEETENLKLAAKIRDITGLKLCVGARKLGVKNYSYDYIGEHANILQISIDLEWYDNIYRPSTEDLMDSVDLSIRKGDSQ